MKEKGANKKGESEMLILMDLPGEGKRVDIILIISRTLQLIDNKALIKGINHDSQMGQNLKHLSHSRRYLAYIWPLSSHYKRFFRVYLPFLNIMRLGYE